MSGPDEGRVDADLRAILRSEQVDPTSLSGGRQRRMAKRHGKTICIVDDDLSLRRSLRNLLMSVGFRVETFESVEAFLEPANQGEVGAMGLEVGNARVN